MPITEHSVTDNKKYKIVFCGEIKPDHDLLSVKSRLAVAFGLNGDSINTLFPGKAVLVKGNLTLNDAQLFKLNFEKTGAICQLLEVSSPPQQPVHTPQSKPAHRMDAPPIAPIISATPSPTASPVRSNNFTFKTVQKKSNTSKYVGLLIFFIVMALLYDLGRNNQSNHPSPEARPTTQTPNHRTPSPSRPEPRLNIQETTPAAPSPSITPVTPPFLSQKEIVTFDDPKQYYSIQLPAGYILSDKSSGERSKITFSFRDDTVVSILASPMRKSWNPEEEMQKKISAINEGKAGQISEFVVEKFQLTNFNYMDGYEFIMRKETQIAHTFALVSFNQIAFAVVIITDGTDSQANHDLLEGLVRESLKPNRHYQQ